MGAMMNGSDDNMLTEEQENELRDLARLAAREPAPESIRVIEKSDDDGKPSFEQTSHDLLVRGVEKIANQWVGELQRVRDNTKVIEQLIQDNVTAVTNAITKLHLLGKQAMIEAERGHQVNDQLATELDRMMQEYELKKGAAVGAH